MKFRKKPVVIEAFKFGTDELPDWFQNAEQQNIVTMEISNPVLYCLIKTLEGTMTAGWGDFIIKGLNGEIYPCKSDIFEKSYERVEE